MKWKITYFNKRVFNSIKKMPKQIKARYVALTDRMIESGPDLGMPHTRSLGNSLFEIRVKAQEGIARMFYCTQVENEIIILHAFIKKTQKTPQKELLIARKRLNEVKHHG